MFSLVGQQLGNYRLHSLLGQGGAADVYLGEHVILQTRAAIKVLHTRMTQQELQQFVQEARTVAHFRHEHIVRVLDFGFAGATPFLVMDFAAHGSLRQLHPHGTWLPLATIVSYVKQIASALQYAHQHKMIHRDVKPENVLMNAEGSLLLGDFGLAIEAHCSRSLSAQAPLGTVRYMAPEQLRGRAQPSSDQYALAVMVYEWLSGIYPFDGESAIAIALHHLIDPPPALSERLPNLAPEIVQVVMRGLAKEPRNRYETVQDFAVALEASCLQYMHMTSCLAHSIQSTSSGKLQTEPLETEKTLALDLQPSILSAQAHNLLTIAWQPFDDAVSAKESGELLDVQLDYASIAPRIP